MDEILVDDVFDGELILTDEDGKAVRFEFLDLIEYKGDDYAVLFPLDSEENLLHILKVQIINDNEEAYIGIDDEEIISAVFELFKEKYKDEFKFRD